MIIQGIIMPTLISHKLIFLNSSERDLGTISNAFFTLPTSLTDIDNNNDAITTRASHERRGSHAIIYMRILLNDFVCPRTFYNTEGDAGLNNNKFAIFVSTSDAVGAWHIITIPPASYNSISAKSKLETILNDRSNPDYWNPVMGASVGVKFDITYDFDKATYTYNATPTTVGQTITQIDFDFSSPHGIITTDEFGKTAHDLLGFYKELITFTGGLTLQTMESTKPATTQTLPALYIRCPNLSNENLIYQNGGYSKSDIIGRVFLTAAPFSNLVYLNIDNDYTMRYKGRYIDRLNILLTDEERRPLELVDDWAMTLRYEIWEEASHEEIDLLEQINTNTKTLLLQNDLKKPQ